MISDTVRRFEFQAVGSETAAVWQAGYFNDLDRLFHRTLDRHEDDVLRRLRAGEEPPIPAMAGRRVLELARAAIRSFETGTRIPTVIADDRPKPRSSSKLDRERGTQNGSPVQEESR
ncbi:MAG: hypothetical protein H0U37_06460 [Chloroflexi bacterium]|nr:hypothetical protein [Chloroflexota bacterium]